MGKRSRATVAQFRLIEHRDSQVLQALVLKPDGAYKDVHLAIRTPLPKANLVQALREFADSLEKET